MLTIKSNKRIIRILREGRVYETALFKIHYLANESGESGFVITVSKKLGNAVKRNYVKRIVKNIIRHKNLNYDLIIRPKFLEMNYKQAKEDLENFWSLLD